MELLSLITIGSAYLSADKPREALDYFQHAEQIQSWVKSDGEELVYLLAVGIGCVDMHMGEFGGAQISYTELK